MSDMLSLERKCFLLFVFNSQPCKNSSGVESQLLFCSCITIQIGGGKLNRNCHWSQQIQAFNNLWQRHQVRKGMFSRAELLLKQLDCASRAVLEARERRGAVQDWGEDGGQDTGLK